MTGGRGKLSDPTAEDTADQSTQGAGGLGAGRDAGTGPEPDDVVARERPPAEPTPRRYDGADTDDPVMPSDDPTLKTNI